MTTPLRSNSYSFGHLKSAKSSETVGFAEKDFSHQENGNSENGIVGRLRREKCQRIRILKTVGLADFAEKNANRMGILKK